MPLAPRRYAPGYCAQRRASTNHGALSNQRHTGPLGFWAVQNFPFAWIFAPLWEKRIGEFYRAMVLFQKLAQKYWEDFPEFFKSCPNLPPFRTPIALTQKLWQNTRYLQLSGLNNWSTPPRTTRPDGSGRWDNRMAAQHLPRYLGGLAVDKRRTRSNERIIGFTWS